MVYKQRFFSSPPHSCRCANQILFVSESFILTTYRRLSARSNNKSFIFCPTGGNVCAHVVVKNAFAAGQNKAGHSKTAGATCAQSVLHMIRPQGNSDQLPLGPLSSHKCFIQGVRTLTRLDLVQLLHVLRVADRLFDTMAPSRHDVAEGLLCLRTSLNLLDAGKKKKFCIFSLQIILTTLFSAAVGT